MVEQWDLGKSVHQRSSSSASGGQGEMGDGVGQSGAVEKFPGGTDV